MIFLFLKVGTYAPLVPLSPPPRPLFAQQESLDRTNKEAIADELYLRVITLECLSNAKPFCKVTQRHSVRIGAGGGVQKNWKNYRICRGKGGGGGGVVTRKRTGAYSGEFGRNTFWMVPRGNYNDITFMNFTCLFNSGFNLLQFAQVNLYTTFGNISLMLVMQYK